jgi:general secretion pathway protein N
MSDFLRRRPFLAGLAVVAAALAVLLVFEVNDTSRTTIPGTASRTVSPASAKLLPSTAAAAPEQAYPEVVARPLFTPTRRPAPAVQVAAQPTFQRGQYQLLGVIIAGNNKTAMLKEKANGKIHRVEMGRELNGVKVAGIEREQVTLAQGGENEVLPLQVQKGAAGPHVAAAPAAGGPFAQPAGAPGAAPPPGTPPPPAAPAPAQAAAPAQQPFQIPPASAALLGIPRPGEPPVAPPPQTQPQPQAATPATTTPMTPEELLARRRARRAQTSQ